MASETEELRLVVNLTDNASAGIAKLRNEITQLGAGAGGQSLQKFQQETEKAKQGIKGLGTEAGLAAQIIGGTLGIGLKAAIGGLGAIGAAIAYQIITIPLWTARLREVGQTALSIGANAGQFHSIVQQLGAMGVSADVAKSSMAGVNNAIADLTRQGSALRQELFRRAGPENIAGTKAFIDSLLTARTEAERVNRVLAAGENVYRNALKETGSEIESRARQREFLQPFGVDPSLIGKQVKEMSAAEQEAYDKRIANAKKVADETGKIGEKTDKIVEALKDPAIGEDGVLVRGLKAANSWLDSILRGIEKANRAGEEADRKRREQSGATPPASPMSFQDGRGGFAGLVHKAAYTTGGGGYSSGGGGGYGGAAPYGQTAGPGTGPGAGATPPMGGGAAAGAAGAASGYAGGALSREQYDKTFAGTPLEGQYDKVVAEATKHGVPPSLVAGIMAHESGSGTSRMLRERNNPAGLMDPKTGWKTGQTFGSVEEGIAAAAGTIGKNFRRGGGSIGGMANIYAPQGAANDPGGLNKYWRGGVEQFTRRFTEGAPYGQTAGPGSGPGAGDYAGGRVEEAQSRVAGIRKLPIDPRLKEALDYAAAETGTRVRVTSGGQHRHGGPRTGSLRHDEGGAADFDLLDENGRIIPRGDPRRAAFLERAAAAGAGGTGTGYMSDPRKIHAGITGAGGRVGEGLGAYAGSREERAAVARGLASKLTPQQLADARARQTGSKYAGVTGDEAQRAQLDRSQIDRSTVAQVEGTGKITVDVNAPKGTNVGAEGGGLFKNVEVNRQTQMEPARTGPVATPSETYAL